MFTHSVVTVDSYCVWALPVVFRTEHTGTLQLLYVPQEVVKCCDWCRMADGQVQTPSNTKGNYTGFRGIVLQIRKLFGTSFKRKLEELGA